MPQVFKNPIDPKRVTRVKNLLSKNKLATAANHLERYALEVLTHMLTSNNVSAASSGIRIMLERRNRKTLQRKNRKLAKKTQGGPSATNAELNEQAEIFLAELEETN